MPSPFCEQAIADSMQHGKALLKFISPNDAGTTKSHQRGYYLPKEVWQVYTPDPPAKGVKTKHKINILWQDGRTTDSVVTWYGEKTRAEYRLTCFGKEFPFLNEDSVGNLLVLIPRGSADFLAYVLDLEEDIQDFQAGLGVEIIGSWALYDRSRPQSVDTEDECLDKRFRAFSGSLISFPLTTAFAAEAQAALEHCITAFLTRPSDDRLTACVDAEYRLFQLVERRLCEPEIVRVFQSVDDFLATAQSILQRRKVRAGRSLEHHVERLLRDAGVPFDMRAEVDGTRPDILIPGRSQYLDKSHPTAKLFAIGVKTTCKDRWRQVLNEARRVRNKHILTLQQGVSQNQINEMKKASVTLVVPSSLHEKYPKPCRPALLSIEAFIGEVRTRLK